MSFKRPRSPPATRRRSRGVRVGQQEAQNRASFSFQAFFYGVDHTTFVRLLYICQCTDYNAKTIFRMTHDYKNFTNSLPFL